MSANYFCFDSKLMMTQISIPLRIISSINKTKENDILETTSFVIAVGKNQYYFTLYHKDGYSVLEELWSLSMYRKLETNSKEKGGMTSRKVSTNLLGSKQKAKTLLVNYKRMEQIHTEFRLPKQEQLISKKTLSFFSTFF